MSVIGDYIRKKREENKMNITDLAKKAKISRPYLSQIESGTRNPSPEILKKIHGPLNLQHHDLMYKAGYISKESYDLLSRKQETRERLDKIKLPSTEETYKNNKYNKKHDINVNDFGIIKKVSLSHEIKDERTKLEKHLENKNKYNETELVFLNKIEKELYNSITVLNDERIDLHEITDLNCGAYYKNEKITDDQLRKVNEMLKIILE